MPIWCLQGKVCRSYLQSRRVSITVTSILSNSAVDLQSRFHVGSTLSTGPQKRHLDLRGCPVLSSQGAPAAPTPHMLLDNNSSPAATNTFAREIPPPVRLNGDAGAPAAHQAPPRKPAAHKCLQQKPSLRCGSHAELHDAERMSLMKLQHNPRCEAYIAIRSS